MPIAFQFQTQKKKTIEIHPNKTKKRKNSVQFVRDGTRKTELSKTRKIIEFTNFSVTNCTLFSPLYFYHFECEQIAIKANPFTTVSPTRLQTHGLLYHVMQLNLFHIKLLLTAIQY